MSAIDPVKARLRLAVRKKDRPSVIMDAIAIGRSVAADAKRRAKIALDLA